jgi:sigma-E factor negative regulatory protein RseB
MLMRHLVLAPVIASATLIAVLLSSVNVKAADEDTWQLLQKAAVAARALSYKGIFVCQTSKQIKSVEITHLFDGQNEFARNVILDGSPREVLNHSGNVVIYNPQNEKIIIEKRRGQNMFPAVLPMNLDAIKVSYTLRQAEMERVAGRPAQVLVLEPKDALRYSYRFWVDTEYGLLLKSVMYNHRDEVMESISFNQVALMNTVALDWFKPKIDHSKSYVMENEQAVIANSDAAVDWEMKSLPAGYRKVDQMMRKVHGKTEPVTHVIFSDGLASVSLFIEHVSKQAKIKSTQKNVLSSSGNTNFYTHINHGHLVTVVGDVPEATVVQIANAVVFKKTN